MKCSSCGADIKEGADFCVVCGKPLPKRKKCPKCGTEVLEDVMFCTNCGNRFEQKTEPVVYYEKDESSNPWKWVAIALVAVLLIGGGTYWYFYMMPKNTSSESSTETADTTTQVISDAADANYAEAQESKESHASTFSPQLRANNGPLLYYVVVASRENMEDAASYGQNMPDGLESPVYKAFAKGKTVFRVCCGCYTSKAEAKLLVSQLADNYNMKSWIWQDDTNAECVYRPVGGSGNPVNITPKSTSNNDRKVYSDAYDGYVNIRRSASAKSAIVGELHNGGDGATYLGSYGKWYKVNYYGTIGYCHKDHCYIE